MEALLRNKILKPNSESGVSESGTSDADVARLNRSMTGTYRKKVRINGPYADPNPYYIRTLEPCIAGVSQHMHERTAP